MHSTGSDAGTELPRFNNTSTVLHENPRLRILDVRAAPGSTVVSAHVHPTVRWQVLDSSCRSPAPSFHPAGSSSELTNVSEHERRDLVFEIRQPPRHTEEGIEKLLAAPAYDTAPGQVLTLDNRHVRMWDFRASLGMDKNEFHQHILDNAWVVIGDGSSLNVYTPEDGPKSAAQLIKTVTFHDGFVSWTAVDNGGFGEDGVTPLMPECLHSVDSAVGVEFREYLIELK